MARPHTAVTRVRSLSGNHLLHTKLIAALKIGYARLIHAYPNKIGQNSPVSAVIARIQQPVMKIIHPILITI